MFHRRQYGGIKGRSALEAMHDTGVDESAAGIGKRWTGAVGYVMKDVKGVQVQQGDRLGGVELGSGVMHEGVMPVVGVQRGRAPEVALVPGCVSDLGRANQTRDHTIPVSGCSK